MEIQLIKHETLVNQYCLLIVIDFEEYTCDINGQTFDSSIIELECIPDAIREGFSKLCTERKIDENLVIDTLFTFSEDKNMLHVNIELVHKKGMRLKATKENLEFDLKKSKPNANLKMERILKEFERSLNINVIPENSLNLYVTIFAEKKICYVKKDASIPADIGENGPHFLIGSDYNIDPIFLNELLSHDDALRQTFSNRTYSQEKMNMKLKSSIDQYFESAQIYELVLNFVGKNYYVNFFKVLNKGRKILVNYNPDLQPVKRLFIVAENIYRYRFQKADKYVIIQEFAVEKKQSNYHSRVEIVHIGDNYMIIENGFLAKNRIIHLKNNIIIDTNENGFLHKIVYSPPQSSKTMIYNFSGEMESPSTFIRMTFFEGNLIMMSLNTPEPLPLQPGVSYLLQIKQGGAEERFYTITEKLTNRTTKHQNQAADSGFEKHASPIHHQPAPSSE